MEGGVERGVERWMERWRFVPVGGRTWLTWAWSEWIVGVGFLLEDLWESDGDMGQLVGECGRHGFESLTRVAEL